MQGSSRLRAVTEGPNHARDSGRGSRQPDRGRRATEDALVIADMPFLSYGVSQIAGSTSCKRSCRYVAATRHRDNRGGRISSATTTHPTVTPTSVPLRNTPRSRFRRDSHSRYRTSSMPRCRSAVASRREFSASLSYVNARSSPMTAVAVGVSVALYQGRRGASDHASSHYHDTTQYGHQESGCTRRAM
jgi:hypothetical protein